MGCNMRPLTFGNCAGHVQVLKVQAPPSPACDPGVRTAGEEGRHPKVLLRYFLAAIMACMAADIRSTSAIVRRVPGELTVADLTTKHTKHTKHLDAMRRDCLLAQLAGSRASSHPGIQVLRGEAGHS